MQHQTIAPTPMPSGPATPSLRPALFARYRALEDLRHDYPLILVDRKADRPLLRPLSRVIDDTLKRVAPADLSGEALRSQVLRLEAGIRARIFAGREGRLSDLWREVAAEMIETSGEAPFGALDNNLETARKALPLDGMVIGCDGETPGKVLRHAWDAKQAAKAHRFRKIVDGLILKLEDILKSDHMKSDEAHGPSALASAMGETANGAIDFGALSSVLHRARPEDRLPADRVDRIRGALGVLRCQPFFGPGRASHNCAERRDPYSYTFDTCSAALDAYRERLPDVLEFTKALTVAELEVAHKYRPELHDGILASFDESDLSAEQINLLPSALVCLRDGETESAEIARSYEALACGLPITVMIQVDDLLGPTSPEPPAHSFGAGTARLATMAIGLNNAFVLQCASAHIHGMNAELERGMEYEGPALFSIFSGATPSVPDVAPYIVSAAATESRAFPSFTYDPSAGGDWAARFDLTYNPQREADWPLHRLDYEDAQGQRQSEEVAFTFADFAACDSRYARFFQPVNGEAREEAPVTVRDWMKLQRAAANFSAPAIPVIDPDARLFRVTVEGKLAEMVRRCNDAWRRLQELAGINNSHALRLLQEDRLKREQTAESTPAAETPEPVAETPVPAEAPAAAQEGAADGAPWIETPRCTTCNECVQTNSALFAYDDNKQAYIKDPDAGTYRQLVEAAESCQVSIIHPGQPRNPDEADLEELIERAAPFN
ncbi:ferredoxin [Tropicimonas sp. IMCC6043]|uniref:ferredoxin n=1 Tax=Tropicimonas sp. IMCC6043 TaxID=2510645 RepID=UPI00101BE197|nr:ferredoxin [Tropicimonas sp. IMCC6043]RYH07940.1 ferredoxin [Tropicimonas sp. IMCC6043]